MLRFDADPGGRCGIDRAAIGRITPPQPTEGRSGAYSASEWHLSGTESAKKPVGGPLTYGAAWRGSGLAGAICGQSGGWHLTRR